MRIFSIILIFTLLISFNANSQSKKLLRKANQKFDRLEYATAIPMYEKLVEGNDTSVFLSTRLADCYRLINKPLLAEQHYEKAVTFINVEPKVLYHYASVLKENKKYKESDEWMDKYIKLKQDDELALRQLNSLTYVEKLIADSFKVEITPAEINCDFADWGPAYYQDKVVFSSSRITDNTNKKEKYGWNNEPFLDLFIADKGEEGKLSNVRTFSKELNSVYHEGPVSFSSDNKTIYFTRNNYLKRSKEERVNKLKIYKAEFINNKWDSIKPMWFNSDEYSCGHPSVSADGKRLFFVSDMPSGFGGTDIFVCKWENSQWGKPENLGRNINTAGNEMFPFIHYNDTLFFASNGYKGLGGLDLYYAQPRGDGFEPPHSMGYPINSSVDDFALIMDQPKRSGYFSSNRKNADDNIYKILFYPNPPAAKVDSLVAYNNGFDYNIYPIQNDSLGDIKLINICGYDSVSFRGMKVRFDKEKNMLTYTPPPGFSGLDTIRYTICDTLTKHQGTANSYVIINVLGKKIYLKGLVTDKYSNRPLDKADVKLKDNYFGQVHSTTTPGNGKYGFELTDKNTYNLDFIRDGYSSEFKMLSTKEIDKNCDTLELNVQLVPVFKAIVYFDLDKFTIRPDAKDVLDNKVLEFLKIYPNVLFRLSGHTDARASFGYNNRLSTNRVKSVANYLIKNGAKAQTVKVKEAHGEYVLVNKCPDGVDCPENEHQMNRRVEIEIFKW
jgi:outer membrane protein OmpA-like peptidoglycan-associated protein